MHNKLAIVIPFFKIHFIEKTLQSLAGQTDKRFNLYIGNDASPSNPSELIRCNLKDVDFKYFNYKENLGGKNLTLPWERLINETREEPYIYILGDDDFVDNNFVEEFYKIIEQQKNIHLIRFSAILIDDNGNQISRISTYPEQQSFNDYSEKLFQRKIRSSLSENIFSREAYIRFGFIKYPLAWFTDTRFWLDITYEHSIISTSKALVYTRRGNTNISGNRRLNNIKNLSGFLYHMDVLNSYVFNDPVKNNILKELNYFSSKNKFINIQIIKQYLQTAHIEFHHKLYYTFFFLYKFMKYRKLYKQNQIDDLITYYYRS